MGQCCPLHASTVLYKRVYRRAFCGRCGVTGRFGGVIKNWSVGLLFLHTSPRSVRRRRAHRPRCLHCKHAETGCPACLVAAWAMRFMRVCRWLPLLFVCPRLSAGGVTSSAACVRSRLRGLEEEGIVFQMGTFRL